MEELIKAINKLKADYIREYLAAPMRREYIFGQSVLSKRDVQKAFVMNLKNLISVYTLSIPGVDQKKTDVFDDIVTALDKFDTGSSNDLEDELNDE